MRGKRISINDLLTVKCRPMVVAELSGNHQQDLSLAKDMIAAAARAGVDAIKLQTYTADSMSLPCRRDEFLITDADNLWRGKTLYDLYASAATPWEWHGELFEFAARLGLSYFSSPFDESAVDFLESLSVPCYKIASFELNHIPLIRRVAATGKPLIMSTGMASREDIAEALETARTAGAKDIVLLKCTSTYPASPDESNLLTLPDLASNFGCKVGLSDHTLGMGAAVASVGLGVCMIEKHFVLDRAAGGVDSEFSMEPGEMQQLVDEVANAHAAMGEVLYGGTESEQNAKKYRRSIYFCRPLKKGQVIQSSHLKVIRPAQGLHSRYLEELVGRKVGCDVSAGTPASWQMIEPPSLSTD